MAAGSSVITEPVRSKRRPPVGGRGVWLYGFLGLGLLGAAWAALVVGEGDLSDPALRDTFLRLRGARLAGGFLAGAALAAAGVLVQGLFRNPLASPSVLGTTAGASFGGQVALILFQSILGSEIGASVGPEMIVPFGCLAGALLSLTILLAFLGRSSDLLVLLLTGFILSSLFLSLGGFLTSLAHETWELGRAVVSFSLGSLAGVGPRQVLFSLPLVAVGAVAAWLWSRPLDLLLSGEDEAATLGVDVGAVRLWCAVWVSVLVAAAVSLGGGVSFVGLVVPHALRPFAGVAHRRLLPAAALGGGLFVVCCDVIARIIPSVSEVPLGVVTGLVGAPVFLLLLRRTQGVRRG